MLTEAYALRAASDCGDNAGMMSEMFGAFRDAREKWGTAFTDDVSEQMNRQGERSTEEVGWKWVEE